MKIIRYAYTDKYTYLDRADEEESRACEEVRSAIDKSGGRGSGYGLKFSRFGGNRYLMSLILRKNQTEGRDNYAIVFYNTFVFFPQFF